MPKLWSKNNPIAHARVLELLRYDPETGHFYWRVDRPGRWNIKAGSLAGSIGKGGYRYIVIDRLSCQAHTLAWFYTHNKWPDFQIDHRNLVHDDNRIDNLREASGTQQRANQRVRKDSSTGLKGVGLTRQGKYRAQIAKSGVQYHLGHYDTPEEASAAYAKAADRLFGEFARAA